MRRSSVIVLLGLGSFVLLATGGDTDSARLAEPVASVVLSGQHPGDSDGERATDTSSSATVAPQRWPQMEFDPFGVRTAPLPALPSEPEAPAVAVPSPVPEQRSPLTIPARFLGRVVGAAGTETVFLQMDGRVYAAVEGEVIADVYRLEKVEPAALHFAHIASGERATVQVPR